MIPIPVYANEEDDIVVKKADDFGALCADSDYTHKNVKRVEADGTVVPHVLYVVLHDPKGNYRDLVVTWSLTITPITLNLRATNKSFSKVYDSNTQVDGTITKAGSEKYVLATEGYYTVEGMIGDDAEVSLLDFSATFNTAHVQTASAVYLRNIKVVFADGQINYNYKFASSYELNIAASITPYPIDVEWYGKTEFVYNGSLQAPTARLATGVTVPNAGGIELEITGKQKNVGNYTANVIVSNDSDGNYYSSDYAIQTEGCPYQITKKHIVVQPVSVRSIIYDGQNHTFSDVYVYDCDENGDAIIPEGLVAGDKSGLVSGHRIEWKANKRYKQVGTYSDLAAQDIKILDGAGASAKGATSNYDISVLNGSIEIEKREIILSGILAEDKSYDGNTSATLVYTNAGGNSIVTFGGIVSGDSLGLDTSKISGTFNNASVGSNKPVTITLQADALNGSDEANYYLNTDNLVTSAAITAPSLKVHVKPITRVYGEEIPMEVIYSEFVSGVEAISGDPVIRLYQLDEDGISKNYLYYAKMVSGHYKVYLDSDRTQEVCPNVGTYYAQVVTDDGSISADNYEIRWDSSVTTQTVTITKRPVQVVPTSESISKVYDGTTAGKTALQSHDFEDCYTLTAVENNSISGLVGSDTLTLVYDDATFNSKDVVTANKVTVTGIAIDGDSNYKLNNDSIDLSGTVTKKNLTITANDFNLTYGDENPTYTETDNGFVASEATAERAKITFTSTYDVAVSSKRGVTTAESLYVISPSYTNSNYNVTLVPGSVSVAPATLTLTPKLSHELIYGKSNALPDMGFEFNGW